MPNKVFLSHSGKQHSYHTAKALNDNLLLGEYHTSSYVSNRSIQKIIEYSGNNFFSRRYLKGLSGKKIHSNWRYELNEFVLNRFSKDRSIIQKAVYQRDVSFDRHIASKLRKSDSNIFWGFQGSCYNSLKEARNNGKITVCELSTGHVLESISILSEEAKLNPDWADSFDNLYFPSDYKVRLENEPFVADKVIAASNFTRGTLLKAGVPEEKIKVLPLGFDSRFIPFDDSRPNTIGPLKLLYTGRVTQRKGISYLLEAMKSLQSIAELDIIGFVHGSGKGLRPFKNYYKIYPSLSQHDLFCAYSNYDVLVLPSLFEGFGLVILEALAAGLPVITTRNTIGADIIKDHLNGFLVDIRSSKGIEEAVNMFVSKSDEERYQMRLNARRTALMYTWDNYAKEVSSFINEIN